MEQIQPTKQQMEKMIYETYPLTKKEKNCNIYKMRMETKRELLRKRLINEWAGKKKIYS